jgi:hypothetical protein
LIAGSMLGDSGGKRDGICGSRRLLPPMGDFLQ